jgi:hypothetical protein
VKAGSRFRYQDDRKTVASAMSLAATNFVSPVRIAGEELLQIPHVMRAALAVADQHHAGLKIARLPGVKKPVRGSQCQDIAGIAERGWIRRVPAMSPPTGDRQEKEQNSRQPAFHAAAGPPRSVSPCFATRTLLPGMGFRAPPDCLLYQKLTGC